MTAVRRVAAARRLEAAAAAAAEALEGDADVLRGSIEKKENCEDRRRLQFDLLYFIFFFRVPSRQNTRIPIFSRTPSRLKIKKRN